ncbi:MAG: hypothetical protein KAT30_07795 [Candidatus Krumholzibacteria bacterium]|nr:hypothetical protein [Candidatus Krumholzibacteria bacterium]
MKEERKQILEMLADGKISAEDAERLIDKLGAEDAGEPQRTEVRGGSSRPKYLRVHVDGSDGDKVDVRIPLALIKTGIKLTAVMPDHVSEKLGEKGVDLTRLGELEGDELYEALRDLQVDVDSGDGTVRVYCE